MKQYVTQPFQFFHFLNLKNELETKIDKNNSNNYTNYLDTKIFEIVLIMSSNLVDMIMQLLVL